MTAGVVVAVLVVGGGGVDAVVGVLAVVGVAVVLLRLLPPELQRQKNITFKSFKNKIKTNSCEHKDRKFVGCIHIQLYTLLHNFRN